MNEQKIREVFADESFVKELMALEEPEEVQKTLAEKDIELSVAEVEQLGDLLTKKMNGEIDDEKLAEVAGGSLLIAAGAIATICSGIGGTFAGYYYEKNRW